MALEIGNLIGIGGLVALIGAYLLWTANLSKTKLGKGKATMFNVLGVVLLFVLV